MSRFCRRHGHFYRLLDLLGLKACLACGKVEEL